MARQKSVQAERAIESYQHADKERLNNPPVGLVTPETDPDAGRQTYAYDPHLDPQLQWAGKAEHTSFEVPTISLHVHERIDPRTIVEAVRRPPAPPYTGGERGGRGGQCNCRCSRRREKTRPSARPSSSTATSTAGPTA